MKNIILTSCLFVSVLNVFSQSLEATYRVKQDIVVNFDKIGEKTITSLESTGKLYRKGSRYIYFEVPAYLKDHPDGKIVTELGKDWTSNYILNTDTIQRLNYKDTDSLIRRTRIDVSGNPNGIRNFYQYFDSDFYEWNMLGEIKSVSGLKCQKAELTIKGIPQWQVWFTADVPMNAGISNIIGLPGLVVEAYNIPLKTTYSLTKFSTDVEVPDSVFWPNEFREPFSEWKPLSRVPGNERSKAVRQAELSNQ